MNLRMLEHQWAPFVQGLCARRDVETAGIILAERLHQEEGFLARHFVVVPDDGYMIRRVDQLRLAPVAINRIVRQARGSGLSIFTVHTHPGTVQPWFSAADDAGDSRLMPSFFDQMPGPHGSLVVAGDSGLPAGRVWSSPEAQKGLGVRIVGRALQVEQPSMIKDDGRWFDRQQLALGSTGQASLRGLHVVVVGLGGTGSVVFLQLAHLGVGRITVVDGDRVDSSNVSRILGATSRDAGVTFKVDVAVRYAEQLGLGTRVEAVRGHLGTDAPTAAIEHGDVAFSCVDRHTPRALLNRLSYEKAIPMIDMGCSFRVDKTGRVVAGAGRVVVLGPGRPCLACWGHIDPSRLRVEALSPTERARQAAEGYVDGADIPQPSVVAFNTTVAGAAVVELLRLVTGFAGANDPPTRLGFDFETGTVRRSRLPSEVGCSICSQSRRVADQD